MPGRPLAGADRAPGAVLPRGGYESRRRRTSTGRSRKLPQAKEAQVTRGKHRSATILAVSVLAATAFLVAVHTDGVSADNHDDEPAPAAAVFPGYDWVNQNAVLDMLFLELTGVPWGQTSAADDGDDGDAGADDELTEEGMDGDGASAGGDDGSGGDADDELTEVEGPRCYTIAWVGGIWSILVEVPCP